MVRTFDIVVIGGGHAGAEAAWAAGRMGCRVALVTLSAGGIAQMSCNPAIGGVGKGQIVREIDALGGLMGLAADATGIQFRMLNRSKGPAVWGPRCQSDRHAYAAFVQAALAQTPNLEILEGEATDIIADSGHVSGVKIIRSRGGGAMDASGQEELTLGCRAVIVTAGTFLRGLMHCGEKIWPGGRYDEPAAGALSLSLENLGVKLSRLKTGTCPRIASESIDYSRCQRQDGDDVPLPFSYLTERLELEQTPCYLTATNAEVHRIIRENLHRAPMFTGQIQAAGPRYCPSLETKIDRFADKDSHPIFIEPEGRSTNWVYLNGVSTSLPPDVQERIVHGIVGLENARVLRWGYAIEYDFAQPTQLHPTLDAKAVAGLYLAGQINGTTGYEEAAAQGLLAGINAALALRGQEGVILRRDQGYIGVMIDDLVTRGVLEPYRMFTSRAEHRLLLRSDNADRRLTELGRQIGLVDERRWEVFSRKQAVMQEAGGLMSGIRLENKTLRQRLAQPEVTLEALMQSLRDLAAQDGQAPPAAESENQAARWAKVQRLLELYREQPTALEGLAIDYRYAGYVEKELVEAARMAELEAKRIPRELDYAGVLHLRAEARERLSEIRPATLAQALRVSGVTPADITILMIHMQQAREGSA